MKKLFLLNALLILAACSLKAQTNTFRDESLTFHQRATDLVSRLTLQEKISQMGNMVDTQVSRTDGDGVQITLPMYQYWNEALHGVARSGAATSFPESKGMSSTWDRQLIYDCATAISDEESVYNNLYNKGLNYWCPTINMARDPRWGRDEENYGEDPFLAGQLAVQFIKGMQGNNSKYLKTVACAKHFAANNYEQGRQGSTSYMTKHNLREYYLPAFEMSVKEGGVKSIMSSYNALSTDINETNAAGVKFGDAAAKGKAWGGKPNAMNDWLLTGILRDEWGFDGYVTSDCAGVSCIYRNVKHCYYGPNDDGSELQDDYKARATADAIKAGNDMNCEFKNQTSIFQTALEAAIAKGYITEADLDKALIRVLETRFALGEFDGANPWSSLGAETLESAANQTLALKAAQESIVLLKNEKADANDAAPLLPISADKTVALIGPSANQMMLGDYSGTPTYTTTPFQAFAAKMNFTVSDGTIQAESFTSKSNGANGVDASYPNELANTAPGVWFCYENVDFGTTPCKDFIMACATKNTGFATVNFILDNPDGEPFLSVGNVDNNSWHSMTTVTATIDEANRPSGVHTLYVKFTGSNKYAGNYDYFRFYNEGVEPLETAGPLYMVQTSAAVNEEASDDMIARAVAVAQKADVVVFCGGTDYSKPDDHATGTESHDRWKITMPGNQTALLQALYAVNKNVVLVLETNSSMDITWEKANIPAIIEAWYGGQAQGQAICDVIYGDVNPSGKLTSTWYNSIDELPSASDSQFGANGMLEYNIDDWGYTYMYYGKGTGANVARQATAPMYPFGYGLSYTTFAYSNADIANDHVTFTITNTGDRAGAEVAQVYVSFPGSQVAHIQKLNRRLVGFERVALEAGQSKEVTIPINKDQLAYYKDDTDEWWVEGGTVNVYISASSADDRLTGSFEATAELLDRTVGGSTQPEEHQDEPEPVVNYESADIKNNEGERENGVWTNGIYTLSTTSLDGYNQYFKMNGSNYIISVPADVVVSQVIFKECSNNYAGNDARLQSVTSEGATATIPEDNKFYHSTEGDKHDIVVELANHTAGRDISFNLPKKGQPMCWIQLTVAKQNPETAPAKTTDKVTVVNNHAVVAVTFDREIADNVEATINNTTVTAEGGSTTLLFPVWGLSYETNYSLNIAAGAVTDTYGNSTTEAIQVAVNVPAKPAVAQAVYDYVVSNATELQDAIAAVNESNKKADAARKTIFLKNGDYDLGNLVGQGKSCAQLKCYNVSLVGESRDGVIIHGETDGISNPILNLRDRTGFYLQDLTVRNDHDYGNGLFNGGVAVAIYGGDKTVMKRVRMLSNQDTQVTGHRAYFEDCAIHGTVDFICGGGDNFYQNCDLVLENRGGDVIAAPSTNASHKWGYVFQECTIKAVDGATAVTDGSWNLGRPWQNEPRAYYLNTTMQVLPSDNGWTNMSNLPTHFYEYGSVNNNGEAIDLSVRGNSPSSTNHYTPILTAEEAARYTVENVLGGTDSWLPTEQCVVLAAPTASISGSTLQWTAVTDARCYVVFKDGQYLTNLTASSLDGIEAGSYTVRAANLNGGLGDESDAVVKQATVTTGATGWATACLTYDAQVPADAKAYYISKQEGATVTLTELTTIPAGEGFILNAEAGDHVFAEAASAPAVDNLLVGTTAGTTVEAGSVYVLAKLSDTTVGMALYNGTSIAAGKAYLPKTAEARSLTFVFDDSTVAVRAINGFATNGTTEVYNLHGQRLSQPKKGISIVGGKKVIVK